MVWNIPVDLGTFFYVEVVYSQYFSGKESCVQFNEAFGTFFI